MMTFHDSKPSKVFTYCASRPLECADQVDAQMRLAHAYYNKLVEIEREKQAAVEAALLAHCPEYREAREAADKLKAELIESLRMVSARRQRKHADGEGVSEEPPECAAQMRALRDRLRQAEKEMWASRSDGLKAAEEALAGQSHAYADARAEVERLKVEVSRLKVAHSPRAEIDEVAARLGKAKKERRLRRNEAGTSAPEPAASIQRAESERDRQAKQARKECGIHWGTYLITERAVAAATKDGWPDPPRFRRWDGSGHLAVQIQRGMPVEDLFKANSRAWIDPVPEQAWTGDRRTRRKMRKAIRTLAHLRIGTEQRDGKRGAPIFAVLPAVVHRPPRGTVKWLHLIREPMAMRHRWLLQVTCELDQLVGVGAGNGSPRGALGLDIGWRILPNGDMRVAYWRDEAGHEGELKLDARTLSGFGKVESLRSIRDERFNDSKALLKEWIDARERGCAAGTPDWLINIRPCLDGITQWRRQGHLAALLRNWRTQRFPGDDEMVAALEAWARKDRHLWSWEANLRDHLLARRREVYRVFASWLAKNYGTVIIEQFDLRVFARRPNVEDGPAGEDSRLRYNRSIAALSVLRNCIQSACQQLGRVVVKVPARRTTMICHLCGSTEEWDHVELRHKCGACGNEWDQDQNAAHNLLRLGRASGPAAQPVV